MAWAAKQTTTREEDIDYCLIGLFDINMPLLYGEGGMKAFARLQEEIIKRGLDQSFLAWLDHRAWPRSVQTDLEFFAYYPKFFQGCEDIAATGDNVAPFSVNNRELQIPLPIFQEQHVERRSSQ